MLFKISATLRGEIPLCVFGHSIIFACINGFITKGLGSNLIIWLRPASVINQFFKFVPSCNSISPQNSKSSSFVPLFDLFDVVLLFNSEDELEKFNEYVLTQQDRFTPYKEDEVPYISDLPGYNVEELKQQWFDARTFKKLLDEFRNPNY